ncbi:MAG: phospho-sugar mutase, partial [Clostridiales bacterium]|nr:phospho-sugar mutase [Clostridiales bacterium]
GFEESYGYLSGGYVRDKDGVDASMLICEMAWYYKRQGKTLADAMEGLYRTYGYYQNALENFTFEGEDGMKQMAAIMEGLRRTAPKEIAGFRVVGHSDYQRSIRVQEGAEEPLSLPRSNVLEYRLENGGKVIVRPSGTEPKIKIYLSARADSRAESDALIARLRDAGTRLLRVEA